MATLIAPVVAQRSLKNYGYGGLCENGYDVGGCKGGYSAAATTPASASMETPYGQDPGYGASTSNPPTPLPDCKVVPDDACVFPFEYNGIQYEECTTVDKGNGVAWCSRDKEYNGHWRDCKTSCSDNKNIGAIVGGTVGGAAAIAGIGLIAGAAAGGFGDGPGAAAPALKAAAPPPQAAASIGTQVYTDASPVAPASVAAAVKLYAKQGELPGSQVSRYGSTLTMVACLTAITLLLSGAVYTVRRHVRQSQEITTAGNNEEDLEQSAGADKEEDSGNAPLITSPIPMVEASLVE